MRFKFLTTYYHEVIKEMDALEFYPRTNNYVIINETKYQITAIHFNYDIMEVHFYCS